MSGIFQEMLSNQHCTFLSFSCKRTESVSGWLCNSDSHHLKKSLVENRQKKKKIGKKWALSTEVN